MLLIYLDSSKGYENYEWYKLSFQRSGRDRASADKPKIQVRGLFEIPNLVYTLSKCGIGGMADAYGLGPYVNSCGFKSHIPHQVHESAKSSHLECDAYDSINKLQKRG